MSARVVALACLAAAALAAAAASPAAAQVEAAIELGAGQARTELSDELSRSGAVTTLAPSFVWRAGLLHLAADGAYTEMGRIGWGAAGRAAGSLFTPRLGRLPLRGELAAGWAGSRHERARGTSRLDVDARLHLHGATRGLWLGLGQGRGAGDGMRAEFVRVGGGLWGRLAGIDLRVGVERSSLTGMLPGEGTPNDTIPGSRPDTLQHFGSQVYTDLTAAAAFRRGRVELGAAVVRREAPLGLSQTGWRLDGAYRLTPAVALVGATGRYAAQLPTALPGGRYTTLSLRVALAGAGRPENVTDEPAGWGEVRPPHGAAGDAASAAPFSARRLGDGLVRIELAAPGARQVEIAGDFTDWRPVALAPVAGRDGPAGTERWAVVLPVPRGVRRANVRFDGGPWQVPPGTTPLADDFGGTVGVFTVE